jgi:myb proto-oncogene protein
MVAVASADASPDLVAASPTQPDARATRAPRRAWTSEEDTKLAYAVETTGKKKCGEEYKTDWVAIAVLVPDRTKKQCKKRWHYTSHSKSDEPTARVGKWTVDEDSTMKDAVEKHNGKNWEAIAALVPGRSKRQCMKRWHDFLHPKSDETTARVGKWTTEEDAELTDAVEKHKGGDWAAISTLVPGRTRNQCYKRWHNAMHLKSDETTARVGKWTTEEDVKLKDAVEKYSGKNWVAISALVPGRTKNQCCNRWHDALHPKRPHARVTGQQKKMSS